MAEITELLSPEAIKQGEQFIKMLETAAAKYTELAKVYDTISDKTRVQIKEEQELEKLNKLKLQTDAQAIKNEQALARELEKKAAQQQKAAKAAEKELSAYEKLSNKYKEAAKLAKDLGAAVAGGNKSLAGAYNIANKEALKYKNQLDGINSKLGNHQSKVGSYFKSMVQFAGSLGLVTGGAALLTKGFELLKNSSQTFGDAFAIKMAEATAVTQKFFSMLGTGDFSNFLKNMQEAAKAGREYAKALDDLFEGGMGLTIAESNARKEKAIYKELARNRNLSLEERLEYAKKYLKVETDIVKRREIEAKKEYETYLNYFVKMTGLDEEKFISYLKNYRETEKLRDEIERKQKEIEGLTIKASANTTNAIIQASKLFIKDRKEKLAAIESSYTEEEKMMIETMNKYNKGNDEMTKNAVQAYAKITDIQAGEYEERARLIQAYNGIVDDINKDAIKTAEDQNKLGEAYLKDILDRGNYDKKQKETAIDLAEKSREEKLAIFIKEGEDFKANQEETTRIHAENEERKTKKAEEEAEKQKQIEEQKQAAIHSIVKQTSDTIFSIQELRLSQEMDALDVYYQSRIESESNLGKNTEKLEREYAIKKYEIQVKEFKLSQQKALADIAIAAAVNSVETPALTGFYIAMAALQAGIVLAQKAPAMPAYAEGTDDAARTFLAGEAGFELMKLAGGGYELATKPKIYSGSKYEHAEIFPHDETQQILAANQMNGLSMSGVERKLDRLIAKETAPVINIINKHDYRYTKRYERMGR
jgi:hypothetical protein